ncbi:MAG TPA: hypothetical protein V6C99_08725 [Oculatellaceae cyanobacterium]|jgi:hypothetical protein
MSLPNIRFRLDRFLAIGMLFSLALSLQGSAFAQQRSSFPNIQALSTQPMNVPAALTTSSTSALQVQAGSQKVPAGTMLTVAFNTPLDSRTSNAGDPFNGYLTHDFAVLGANGLRRVILPTGTLIRGRVQEVKRPSYFSRGGALFLTFDHVVLPSGEQLPLVLNLSTENTAVKDGAVYMDPGIGKKMEKGLEKGKETFSNITEGGIQAGKQIAGGLGTLITVPASVLGGAVAGAGVTTGKAAVALVGKGDSAVIKPGDTMNIDFGGSFTLPAE